MKKQRWVNNNDSIRLIILRLGDNKLRPEIIEGYLSRLNIAVVCFKMEGRTC